MRTGSPGSRIRGSGGVGSSTDGVRVISSIREVVDADGPQVVSNEVYFPGPDRAAVLGAPIRDTTLDDLCATGYLPPLGGLR